MATERCLGRRFVKQWIAADKNYILGEAYTSQGLAARSAARRCRTRRHTRAWSPAQSAAAARWETSAPRDVSACSSAAALRREIASRKRVCRIWAVSAARRARGTRYHQSNRAPGTEGTVAIPLLNLQKSRLNDPMMWFLGTNDQPGDIGARVARAATCVRQRPRSETLGPYAQFGNETIAHRRPHDRSAEPGHLSEHRFTSAIPTASAWYAYAPANMFMNTFMGYTMWDYESDARRCGPAQRHSRRCDDARRQ